MLEETKKHGMFSWNELLTSDVEAAKSFYGELLGWTLEDCEMSEMPYTVIKSNDMFIGGIMQTPAEAKGMPPMWGPYVTVDDVHAVAKRAIDLGGKILLDPKKIPETGTFCVIQDPQGATLSIISYDA